jgi:hypothetical protein
MTSEYFCLRAKVSELITRNALDVLKQSIPYAYISKLVLCHELKHFSKLTH